MLITVVTALGQVEGELKGERLNFDATVIAGHQSVSVVVLQIHQQAI